MQILKNFNSKELFAMVVALLLGILILLLQFYRWEIIDIITPFLQWPFEMAIYCIFFVTLAILTFLGIRDLRALRIVRLVASLFMIITYLITIFVNFNGLWISHYFSKYKDHRWQVIKLIEDGVLKPNVSHDHTQIHLDPPFDKTSMGGGDILFNFASKNRQVFFFSFRGILDAYSGFYYSSEDMPPVQNSLGLEFKDFIKLEKNWYWIGTCNKSKNEALGILLQLAPILQCS